MSQAIWSISSLVRYIKASLDRDMNLQSILIKGKFPILPITAAVIIILH